MIIICEPICYGYQHAPVNSGLLEILFRAYPDTSIVFCAEKGHLEEVRRLVAPEIANRISWRVVVIPDFSAKARVRFPLELGLLKKLFHEAANQEYLFLSNACASTLFAIKLLNTTRFHPVKVQVIIHSVLAELEGWRSRNPFVRAVNLRSSIICPSNRYLQYIVLESAINRKLSCILPQLKERVVTLNHPVTSCETISLDVPHVLLDLPIKIGFLGLATQQKGFDLFCDMATRLRKKWGEAIEFHAIGHQPRNPMSVAMDALSTRPLRNAISRDAFVRKVKEMHYICLPYQGRHYDLTASGVLLDAIALGKPILALPTPTVEDLFETEPGIGLLFRDVAAMEQGLQSIVQGNGKRDYSEQVVAMLRLRQTRTPNALATKYRAFTEEFLAS